MDELSFARQTIDEIDKAMAQLFSQRMDAVKIIAACKQKSSLPVEDVAREQAVIANGAACVKEELVPYYTQYIRALMQISKQYQADLSSQNKV